VTGGGEKEKKKTVAIFWGDDGADETAEGGETQECSCAGRGKVENGPDGRQSMGKAKKGYNRTKRNLGGVFKKVTKKTQEKLGEFLLLSSLPPE